jgi:hypothetical protein
MEPIAAGHRPVALVHRKSQETMRHSMQPATSQRGFAYLIAAAAAAVGVLLLFGALVLWAHYGTAVFFEMLASGIAACF